MNRLLLWIAQGFGTGRSPLAPGTFGSILGVFWTALLLWTGHLWSYLAGTLVLLAVSVPVCGAAERLLGRKDPGSVVIDEIAALPLCFLGWVIVVYFRTGTIPAAEQLWTGHGGLWTLGTFAAFRLFDIAKPWPVRQSQSLSGGWGVTADDALAAVYVNGVMGAIAWALGS